jgi:putative oxidoreductase
LRRARPGPRFGPDPWLENLVSGTFGAKYHDLTLNALRIMAGLLFMTHGGQKLFGWFGAQAAFQAWWPMGVAGVLEFFGGLAIALGLFTRYVAFVVAGEMAVAFFWRHASGAGSLWPWVNRGELPVLYCFIWLYIWASGGGRWTVEAWARGRLRSSGHPS